MAVPHETYTYFGSDTVEYKPSIIKKFDCMDFDIWKYNPKKHGGVSNFYFLILFHFQSTFYVFIYRYVLYLEKIVQQNLETRFF